MSAVTRRQAFALVDIADALIDDLIPDHDLVKVDRLCQELVDAMKSLTAGRTADAARRAALIIAIMAGPDAPNQTPTDDGRT
jgi:hypothetical protein